MMSECVIDAELFRKYCPKIKCNSIYEATKCLIDQGFDGSIIQECHCVLGYLDLIKQGKCKLYYSEKIKNEYIQFVDKLPADVLEYLLFILSNTSISEQIQRGGFIKADFDELKSTDIEHKAIYLDVAKALNERNVISSKEDIKNNYGPHVKILLKHTIFCKNICERWNGLKYA